MRRGAYLAGDKWYVIGGRVGLNLTEMGSGFRYERADERCTFTLFALTKKNKNGNSEEK